MRVLAGKTKDISGELGKQVIGGGPGEFPKRKTFIIFKYEVRTVTCGLGFSSSSFRRLMGFPGRSLPGCF